MSAARPRRFLLALVACAASLALAATAQPASADLGFCPQGTGAGQCDEASGVAVDTETGHVYVTDRKNNRVDVFQSDGSFLFAFGWGVDTGAAKLEKCTTASGCQKGIAGAGAGQLDGPRRVAVDNNAGSGSRHDLYVYDAGNFRVQKFDPEGTHLLSFGSQGAGAGQFELEVDPLAVGPGGVVYVGDTVEGGSEPAPRVEKFQPNGALLEVVPLVHKDRLNGAVAVDSTGDMYGTFNKGGGIFKFHPDGSEYGTPYPLDPGMHTEGLAVDGGNNLFASEDEASVNRLGVFGLVAAYDSTGSILSRFGYGRLVGTPLGLALFAGSNGDVFASERDPADQVKYLSLPDPGPIAPPLSLEASPVGNARATLKAEINPEGNATKYHFEYLSQEAFAKQGGFSGPETKITPTVELAMPPGSEFRVHGAQALAGCAVATKQLIAEGKCLKPETAYRFRIIATNADNPTGSGEATAEGGSFTTKAPVEIKATWASEAGTDAATLNAELDPLGIPATGYFQYVTEGAYAADIEAGGDGFAQASQTPDVAAGEEPIDFGSGEGATTRSATLFPLKAGTTYRYRLRATNPLIDAELASEAHTLTTFTPARADSCPANDAFRAGPAKLLPDCRAYELVSPLDKGNSDIAVLNDNLSSLPAVLNQSSTAGSKLAYGSYRAFGDAQSAPATSQYIAVRGAGAWQSHAISPPREGASIINVVATFDTEFKQFSDDLCQSWLRTYAEPVLAPGAIAGYPNAYRWRDPECGEGGYQALTTAEPPVVEGSGFKLEAQGSSADGSVAVFVAADKLTATAPKEPAKCDQVGTCEARLYAAREGDLRFLCILPGGKASAGRCTAGGRAELALRNSREVLVDNAISADGQRVFWSAADEKIYLRENPFGEGAECAEAASPCSLAVSKAGEEASGTTGSQYWGAADDGSRAIFSTGSLGTGAADLYEFDVASKATHLIAAGVYGLVGTSKDAQRVYLVSSKAGLGGAEGATAGKPNLYLYEAGEGGGSYRFVATLGEMDLSDAVGGSSPVAIKPTIHATRVSPDGLHAAFMSAASLTGYDNVDAKSGKADTEVYLYDAAADDGAGKLVCASCNPSGARPIGRNIAKENGTFWAASRLPVWENTLYAPRSLSGDGTRLYFESFDSLVPRDTNGVGDVYQWEQEGKGGCAGSDPTFVPSAGGCVDLVSSGQSLKDSTFVDASPSGSDVFFTTLAGLYPSDYGLIDIYDAREGGGFPLPPAPPAACAGEVCQSPASALDDPTPASASFHGAGDPAPQSKPRKPRCRKGRASGAAKARCVAKRMRAHRAHHRHHHKRSAR